MNLVKILGLEFGKKYTDEAALKALRYGHLMIMADQDQDGSHIKGLVINFIHHNWPHLLKYDFVQQFITPLVKVCVHVLSILSCVELYIPSKQLLLCMKTTLGF